MQINYRLIFYFLILMVITPGRACALWLDGDTASYVSRVYEVEKKKEKVGDIAKKLKVDASLVGAMNDGLSADSILIKGQKIRVPVYFKEAKSTKGSGIRKTGIKGNQAESNTAGPIETRPAGPAIDTELVQTQILLADANLELNQALLLGIQASLDSLNATDKNVVDPKNISATIHNMQRQRDKTLLTPFLHHMQDSLKTEIKAEQSEKASLENILGVSQSETNNAVVASDPKLNSKYGGAVAQNALIDTESIAEPAKQIQPNKAVVRDAVKQPKPSKTAKTLQADKANGSETVVTPPAAHHWETAKALYYNDDASPADPNANDSTFADLQVDESGDTSAYVPIAEVGEGTAPMSDSVRYMKARLFYTKGMKATNDRTFKSAEQDFRKAIDLLPGYYDAWFALGEADAHLGLLTKALNEYKTCAAIDSSKPVLYYKIGGVQLKLKQKAEAILSFNKSLILDSNYIPAIMGRAQVNMDRKKYKAAIKDYTRVLEIDWGYHTAYRSRALAQYWLKNYDAAIDDFTRYIIFDETDGSVYFYRGMAKQGIDETGDACADFSISAKLGYGGAEKEMEAGCK